MLELGARVKDYEVVESLRESASRPAYKARQTGTDLPVVLKLYAEGDLPRNTLSQLAGLAPHFTPASSPHLILPIQAGVWREPAGNWIFVARPYVTGRTLFEVQKPGASKDAELLLSTARSLIHALTAVHAAGLAVGNLKPTNIMLTPAGEVKLTDQGFSLKPEGSGSDYRAPEQAAGGGPTTQADLYSLGSILYYLVKGGAPGARPDLWAPGALVPPPPGALDEIPESLRALVARLILREAGDRPRTAPLALKLLAEERPAASPAPRISRKVKAVPVEMGSSWQKAWTEEPPAATAAPSPPSPGASAAGAGATIPPGAPGWAKDGQKLSEVLSAPTPPAGASRPPLAAAPPPAPPSAPPPAAAAPPPAPAAPAAPPAEPEEPVLPFKTKKKPVVQPAKSGGSGTTKQIVGFVLLIAAVFGGALFLKMNPLYMPAFLKPAPPPPEPEDEFVTAGPVRREGVMVVIPAGEAEVLTSSGAKRLRFDSFQMRQFEVTNEEFAKFVQKTGYKAQGQWKKFAGPGKEKHPVRGVTYVDAAKFAASEGHRLPLITEWEYVARGRSGRVYPWGRSFVSGAARLDAPNVAAVGKHPAGATPHGVEDLAGNVWEWVGPREGQQALLVGGSFRSDVRGAEIRRARLSVPIDSHRDDSGFRTVKPLSGR